MSFLFGKPPKPRPVGPESLLEPLSEPPPKEPSR